MGNHEDCIKYLDGTIYNMNHKTTEILEEAISRESSKEKWGQKEKASTIKKLTMNSSMLKTRLQTKLHLQMCAMLSQINKYPNV